MPRGIIAPSEGSDGKLIEPVKSLSAASTYTVNIPQGIYRRATFHVSGSGGMTAGFPTGLLFRVNGDATANHYSWLGFWNSGTAGAITPGNGTSGSTALTTAFESAITGSAPCVDFDATIRLRLPNGKNRAIESEYESRGAAAVNDIEGRFKGWWLDTTSTVSSVTLVFGAAFTGTVESRAISVS